MNTEYKIFLKNNCSDQLTLKIEDNFNLYKIRNKKTWESFNGQWHGYENERLMKGRVNNKNYLGQININNTDVFLFNNTIEKQHVIMAVFGNFNNDFRSILKKLSDNFCEKTNRSTIIINEKEFYLKNLLDWQAEFYYQEIPLGKLIKNDLAFNTFLKFLDKNKNDYA